MGRGQKRTFRDGTNTTLQNFDRATATLENYYKGANAQSPTAGLGAHVGAKLSYHRGGLNTS